MKKAFLFSGIYAFFGSLGFYTGLGCFVIAAFGERHLYPHRYPFYMWAAAISLATCIAALFCNIALLKKQGIATGRITATIALELLIAVALFIGVSLALVSG